MYVAYIQGKAESRKSIGGGKRSDQSSATTETAPRTGSAPQRGKKRGMCAIVANNVSEHQLTNLMQ